MQEDMSLIQEFCIRGLYMVAPDYLIRSDSESHNEEAGRGHYVGDKGMEPKGEVDISGGKISGVEAIPVAQLSAQDLVEGGDFIPALTISGRLDDDKSSGVEIPEIQEEIERCL